MIISLIAAMAENRVIGNAGAIPWDLPADRHRFRRITMGHPLIMGRRTYESIGHPLSGRATIVVTRQAEYRPKGCLVVESLAKALDACTGAAEVYVCGGTELYREALPRADRLYLTQIHATILGDIFFPPFDSAAFTEISREYIPGSPAVTFLVLERRKVT